MGTDRAPLNVAVVGAGQMGEHHLRILDRLKGANVVAVVDNDEGRRTRAAELYRCQAFSSVEELSGIDAATVAVPSSAHAEVAEYLLAQGIHCLVEKPLATTETACERMIAAAEGSGAVLLVGHVERFNPAVEQLIEVLDGHAIHAIDVKRMSSVSSRITDVDVVMDLMVHDLDIVLALMGEDVSSISAAAVHATSSGEDYVAATLSFPSGALTTLTASRITQNKIRKLEATTELGLVSANFITQELVIYREGRFGDESNDTGSYVLDVAMERVFVRPTEPLVAELSHFLEAARGDAPTRVSGRDALAALRLVWHIQDVLRGSS